MSGVDGGPAFPLPLTSTVDGDIVDTEEFCRSNAGMSLLQYYAGKALPAIITSFGSTSQKEEVIDGLTDWAFMYAKSMIEAERRALEKYENESKREVFGGATWEGLDIEAIRQERKYAARYRFIRDNNGKKFGLEDPMTGDGVVKTLVVELSGMNGVPTGHEVDDIIDVCMAVSDSGNPLLKGDPNAVVDGLDNVTREE